MMMTHDGCPFLYRSILILLIAFIGAYAQLYSYGDEWYSDNWCGGSLEYLDDKYCAKIFPASFDRSWTCPVPLLSTIDHSHYQTDGQLQDMKVDTSILDGVVADTAVNLCVVLTQRLYNASSKTGSTLYNRYLCAGDRSKDVAYETWSSSKVFAVANAAGRLRSNESICFDRIFGIDGSIMGSKGKTPLGDLVTIICSYDHTQGYSSNSLASFFHDVGWRDRIDDLVVHWLGVSNQTLGGNYGEATPKDLSFDVSTVVDGEVKTCKADKDPWPTVYSNTLSALSAVEMVRRLALHREVPSEFRFPGITWTDVQNIMYGSEDSALFAGLKWGGMSSDTAIFTQAALDLPGLLSDWDPKGRGQWRIFSKLGAGYSTSRSKGEIISNAYACLPSYNVDGTYPVGGIEFSIAARGSVSYDTGLQQVQERLRVAMRRAIQYVLNDLL